MSLPELNSFCLAGGTALALKYGYRESVDLDLFSNIQFEHEKVINALQAKFGNEFSYDGSNSKWGVFSFIENIKIDIVYYPHPMIGETEIINDIRFYSDADLIAMKLQAILGRGVKKDFWDIAHLLEKYSLDEMIGYHSRKYPNQMLAISIPQALTYFEDADESISPMSLNNKKWTDIKSIINKKVRDYLHF